MNNSNLPLAIEIEINSDCNLSCAYCPNSKTSRKEKGHMRPVVFENLMRQLQKRQYSGRISYHFYNEPTLSPNLQMFIEITTAYLPNANSVLYSNGTNLTKESIQSLYDSGLKRFVVTEHHQQKLTHLDFISEDLSLASTQKFKFTTYKKLPMTNRGGILKVGPRVQTPLQTTCFIPRCVMVVSVLGNVIACYEDYNQSHVMGNILEEDIYDIWNSEKYIYFRDELKKGNRHKFEVCKSCNNQMIII